MVKIIILNLLMFALSSPTTIDLYLSGKVSFKNQTERTKLEGLYFFIRSNKKVIADDYLDGKGRYDLFIKEINMVNEYHFYFAGNGYDTTFVKSISRFKSDTPTLNFELFVK